MSGIQTKKVAGYVIMPGVVPRAKAFFTSGFGYIAFLIAQIYAMVRLLPEGHPYTQPQNIGQFSIRNVIAEAANQLVFKKENIDQVVIFATILIGLVLLVLQFAMILLALIFPAAMASFPSAPFPTGTSLFITNAPTNDIAFILLDRVFGIPDLYGSCVEQNIACAGTVVATPPTGGFPWPFHEALQDLFQFYNTGILVIGALIFLYFVLIVVGETAVTGTPFGQRFQNVWVPIRLVMAIGLLVPLNYGLNSGQYITLFAAKFGSSLATNGWITYNNTIAGNAFYASGAGANPTGERESLIGQPAIPNITPVLEAMSLVHTCAVAHWFKDRTYSSGDPLPPDTSFDKVQPFFVKEPQDWMDNTDVIMPVTSGTLYSDALDFYNDADIIIRFGENGGRFFLPTPPVPGSENYKGNVIPHCGDIRISIKVATGTQGPAAVQQYYYNLIRNLWFNPPPEILAFAYRFTTLNVATNDTTDSCNHPSGSLTVAAGITNTPDPDGCNMEPTAEWRTNVVGTQKVSFRTTLETIWGTYAANTAEIEMTEEILARGWAGAGIWYNTISRINGAYMESVRDIPQFDNLPLIMKKVREQRQQAGESLAWDRQYCPSAEDRNNVDQGVGDEREIARTLCKVYAYWNTQIQDTGENEDVLTGSIFEDAMNLIFGTQPLSAMTSTNVSTHPLTQLAMLGKGLVDASIRNIATASAGGAIGGLTRAMGPLAERFIAPASSFILSTAFVGLTAGLVLYYILPFLPFVYFYFAVASWVKSIFEAMVGTPLWALAHLRIDGEGLPGNSAANGYFLILEIFLRPILTVFGLVAATLIFTAQVRVLHFMWQIVTENLTGFENDPTISIAGEGTFSFKRAIIDEFFFSIIYTIIVYMMAIAAFKLIDKIPDSILRWIGSSTSAFGDINQDSVDGLTRYAALSGATAGQNLAQGVQGLAQGAGGSVGTLFNRLRGGI